MVDKTSCATLSKPLFLLKLFPILIMLRISFSFNHATIFCINTSVTVLINQYSTGLFVSYHSTRRKIQLHEIIFSGSCPTLEPNPRRCQGGRGAPRSGSALLGNFEVGAEPFGRRPQRLDRKKSCQTVEF